MIQRKRTSGVSPVVGVILMVAITVIIAAVVANFVLDLGQQLGEDADATLTFDQSIDNFTEQEYNVTVSVSDMGNSDYLIVGTVGSAGDPINSSPSGDSSNVQWSGVTPDNTDNAPNNAGGSQSVGSNADGAVMVSSGDVVTVSGLSGSDTVQVFGGISGEENLVQAYEVQDTLG